MKYNNTIQMKISAEDKKKWVSLTSADIRDILSHQIEQDEQGELLSLSSTYNKNVSSKFNFRVSDKQKQDITNHVYNYYGKNLVSDWVRQSLTKYIQYHT